MEVFRPSLVRDFIPTSTRPIWICSFFLYDFVVIFGKKLDSFQKLCKLNIPFFSFYCKISFEKIKRRGLINLVLLNLRNFSIINIFCKILNCNFFTVYNSFIFKRIRCRRRWNRSCSTKNRIHGLKRYFRKQKTYIYCNLVVLQKFEKKKL